MATPRVLLVHDWLTGMRGGEKCSKSSAAAGPTRRSTRCCIARGSVSPTIERPADRHQLPALAARRPSLLPLPAAADAAGGRAGRLPDVRPGRQLEPLRRQGRDAAAGRAARLLLLHADALRLAPAAAPTARRGLERLACADRLLDRLRDWDRETADRVTHFVAISRTVQQRIRRMLRPRQHRHLSAGRHRLLHARTHAAARGLLPGVSAFAPYKRLDLAIEACNRLGRKLVVIGTGQDEKRLRAPGRADDPFPRLAAGRGDPRSPAPLPGAAVSRRGGLRHRAGRGAGVRHAGDRLWPRRGARDGAAPGSERARRACSSRNKPPTA